MMRQAKKMLMSRLVHQIIDYFLILTSRKHRAIYKALSIKGWTDALKLSVLFDLVKKVEILEGDILEIGSAWGRSTVLLGLASKKLIWLIDPHTGGRAYIEKGKDQNSFDEFLKNIEKHSLQNRVRILKNTTQEVMVRGLISDKIKFSLAFIDGLHTPEGVQIDFAFSYKHLVKSGIIVFDDYFEPSVKDYAEMIDKLVQENAINLIKNEQAKLVWFSKP